jgi:chromosome partitioning protein
MILLFGHQKGGVGKSTVAINVAYQAAKKYDDIKILDLDSQNSSLLFNQLRDVNKMKTIPCVAEGEEAFPELVKQYKGKRENLLVIDSGGYDSDMNRAALVYADLIVTPVGLSQIEIFGLQKFRKILKSASEALGEKITTNVLLNNVDSRSKKKLKELKQYIQNNDEYFNLLETVVHTRSDYKHSYGEGMTVRECNKGGIASMEIKFLTKEILRLIRK